MFPTMTNLKPHFYASFDLIKSHQLKTSAFVVILKYDETFTCGILIDSAENEERGWSIFGRKGFSTEAEALIEFNRLCKSNRVEIY